MKEGSHASAPGLNWNCICWRSPITSLLALTLLFTGNAMALSPPWYLLQRQVAAAIGADTGVLVDGLDTTITPYRINVHVADANKAQALACILTPHYDMGNLAVDARVLDSNGMEVQPLSLTAGQEVVDAFTTAQGSNPPLSVCF